jgi:hypothetical protein
VPREPGSLPGNGRRSPGVAEEWSGPGSGRPPATHAGESPWQRISTAWPSLRTDLRNAGAEWVHEQVVLDWNMMSSRKPDDIPAFNREMMRRVTAPATATPMLVASMLGSHRMESSRSRSR